MSGDKLENSHKNVPDKFKCGKCRKILNEACQIRCGCRFCRSCVDEMMNNRWQFCPGITSDCKTELLSTVQLDYRANKQISQLIMKCPEEMCSYEKLIENFQLENINHNKTLIDIIDNIKNEVGELREKELKNHEEINKLKDEKLESINKEMEKMKNEKLEMENRLKNVEEMFNVEITKSMMIDNIDEFRYNIDNVDNVDKMRYVNKWINEFKHVRGIWSEYFYTRNRPYKLKLRICPSSYDELRIYLYIYDDVINQELPFPFSADVTIKIINKNKRELSESTPPKHCVIKKPENNSCNSSDLFTYSIPKLIESGILESNRGFIVECCVELRLY